MPHEISFVENDGTLAHYKMLDKIKTFCEANGWTVLRYDTVSSTRELILKGVGYSGLDEIFVGFRAYQDATNDYYNLSAAVFSGYVDANAFDAQPGIFKSGFCAHPTRIDYWLTVNPQRIAMGLKIGSPVYETAYTGKFFAYAPPSQYPYPVCCGGTLNGESATRYSDTIHGFAFKGNRSNFKVRRLDGNYGQALCHPWSGLIPSSIREFTLTPITLHESGQGVYGILDGVYHITGFSNAVENTTIIDGETYVILQDVFRTGFGDFIAMRMDS